MKRFLPTLPAFLLCFAGGWALHQKPADSSRAIAVASWLPVDDAGYGQWQTETRNKAEVVKQINDSKAAAEKLGQIAAVLAAGNDSIAKLKNQLEPIKNEYSKKQQEIDEVFKGWKTASDNLGNLKPTFNDVQKSGFDERVNWVVEYNNLKSKYIVAKAGYEDLEKQYFPQTEGGKP